MFLRTFLYITAFSVSGCGALPEKPCPACREVPEAYLQECEVPPVPDSNGELSEAYVGAAQCAILGNEDKRRIRELLKRQP